MEYFFLFLLKEFCVDLIWKMWWDCMYGIKWKVEVSFCIECFLIRWSVCCFIL